MIIRRLLCSAVLLTVVSVQFACSVNPATGKLSYTRLSWEEEKALGLDAAPQFIEQYGGEFPDPDVRAYVDRIGTRLVAQVEAGVPDLDWEFTLLNSESINAFALPGGKVFITRGLAVRLGNEAEMAGVLGHEIGHVTARHANQRMSKQGLIDGGIGLVVAAVDASDSKLKDYTDIGVPALEVGRDLLLLKYGRDEESEADMLGMRYMHLAGYDPASQRRVMEVLMQAGAGQPRQIEWLATHPFPETRIERIDRILAERYPNAAQDSSLIINEREYERIILRPLRSAAHPPARAVPDSISAAMLAHRTCCPAHGAAIP